MSDLKKLIYFLGMEVKQFDDGIFLSQRKYACDVLKSFKMAKYKSSIIPFFCK